MQRPKQAELAHATKETPVISSETRAERSRADASDAVYNSKMSFGRSSVKKRY